MADGYDSWEGDNTQVPGPRPLFEPRPRALNFPLPNPAAQPADPPPQPVVTPAPPGAPPDAIGDVTFPRDTPYPLEQLPGPATPEPPIHSDYEVGPNWYEIRARMEAIRYQIEGYDREEFGWDYDLHPSDVDDLWPIRPAPPRPNMPPIWVPQQVGTPPQGMLEFVPRPQPQRRNDIPMPTRYPNEWTWPIPRRAPRRRAPSLGWPPRFEPRIPEPLPSERNPNPPPAPPRRFETPAPPLEVPELYPMPQPSIPVPQPTQPRTPAPSETQPPSPVYSPQPLPPRVPAPRTAPPRPARWPQIAQPVATAAAILRRYITRRDEPQSIPRLDFRDFVTQPVGDLPTMPQPVMPQPVAPPQVAPPVVLPDLGLTPLEGAALPFASAQPQTRRREDECRCEDETEEEAEERRESTASNVFAEVRTFRRRMSQNSLDNLKGKFR